MWVNAMSFIPLTFIPAACANLRSETDPRSQHVACGLTLEDPDVRLVAKALRTGTVRNGA